MKIALGLEYCGAQYFGWQRQAGVRTIQACVEDALSRIANHRLAVHCAGRTDTGVHALHQVVHIETAAARDMHSWVFGGNTNLPHDISLLWAKEVAADFHARYSATGRTYRYVILNRPARSGLYDGQVTWQCRPLDEHLMNAAAASLVGEHDFTSYRAGDCQAKTPVRTIRRLGVSRRGDFVIIDVAANAFLQHMVRNIAGVLMTIGMSREPVDWARKVLEVRDRAFGGLTAPPDGLYLVNVEYPEHYGIPQRDGASWSLPG